MGVRVRGVPRCPGPDDAGRRRGRRATRHTRPASGAGGAHRPQRARALHDAAELRRRARRAGGEDRLLRHHDLRQPGPPGGVEGAGPPAAARRRRRRRRVRGRGRRQHPRQELPGPVVRRPDALRRVQPRRAGGTAGASREVRPLPDAGRRRRRRHRGRDADRAVHRRGPGARRPRAAPRPGRRADDDDRQQHVLHRRDADRSGVAVRRRPRVAVPAGRPGRPRLRAERQDRRARHGAPRRSRDEEVHHPGRRVPQRLRPRLQPRRRAVHVRQRHGVGHRHAVVSRDPHGPRRARRRLRLPQRLRQAAGLGLRQPAAAARRRPRIAGRGRVLPVAGLPDGDARRAARSRLVARPPALHAADPQGRELRRRRRPHRAGARRAAQHHRRRGRSRRPGLLHDRRPRHRRRRLQGDLQRREAGDGQADAAARRGAAAAAALELGPCRGRQGEGRPRRRLGDRARIAGPRSRGPRRGSRPGRLRAAAARPGAAGARCSPI